MISKLTITLAAILTTAGLAAAQACGDTHDEDQIRQAVEPLTQSAAPPAGDVVVSDGGPALHGLYFCGFNGKTLYCGNNPKAMIAEGLIPVDPPGGAPGKTIPVDPPGGTPGTKSTILVAPCTETTDEHAEAHGFQPPK